MDDKGRIEEIIRFARELGALLDSDDPGVCEGPYWSERMRDLGFEMDCWESFDKVYGTHSAETPEGYARLLERVDDVQALGNGAFSQWRYINHWATGDTTGDLRALRMLLARLEELTATGA